MAIECHSCGRIFDSHALLGYHLAEIGAGVGPRYVVPSGAWEDGKAVMRMVCLCGFRTRPADPSDTWDVTKIMDEIGRHSTERMGMCKKKVAARRELANL